MNRQKGFSLIEAMVGLVILAVAITGALSFFIFQSRTGFISSRLKTTDEELFFTRTLISRDICQAGYGVATHPELAVYITDGGTNPDQIYINYSGHLTMEETSQLKSASMMAALKQNSVYYESGATYQGFLRIKTAGVSNLTLSAIPKIASSQQYPEIAGFITNTGGVLGAVDAKIKLTTGVDGTMQGTQDWSFPLVSSITGTSTAPTYVAPAVSYRLVKAAIGGTGEVVGGIWRNRGDDANPYGSPLFGGTPFLEVTNLKVRCQFQDGTWSETNSPAESLRMVEVTISYRTRGKSNFWNQVQTHVIVASPRTVSYL